MNKKVKVFRTGKRFSTLTFLILLVVLGSSWQIKGQNPIPNRVEVRIRNASLLPGTQSLSSSALQQVYSTYNVTGYVQKYPAAVGLSDPLAEGLTRVYDLICDCDVVQLQNALSPFNPGVFENVYLTYEEQLLSTPPPYLPNDSQNADWNFWPHDLINTPEAWDITKGDPGVKIAITDFGYDVNHPDLVDKIIYAHPLISQAGPGLSHGTGTAFTAAGGTDNGFGLSSAGFNCSLMLFPIGYPYILEAAVEGANIINCSWFQTCSYNQNHHDVIKVATNLGSVIVAGAGNGNAGSHCGGSNLDGTAYPASYPEVISVSGTAHYGCLETTFNCWSPPEPAWIDPKRFTLNSEVDVVAPGFCVMTAIFDDNFGFSVGTSTSSPMVGGVIGLMLSVDPCLSPGEVSNIIKDQSQSLFDGTLCSGGNNNAYETNIPGVGMVDANASVTAANSSGTEFHINAGETQIWDNQTIEAKDIYVHSGGTLIIRNGSVVNMKKGKSIIVEREAKLIVNNSTIGAGCSKSLAKWQGIFVHGNASLPQPNLTPNNPTAAQNYVFSPKEAGVVVLTNNSRIENARYGVSTSAPGFDYAGQTSSWGGLVLVDNTTFYNVVQGIEFLKYDLSNKSRVTKSIFEKSADYDTNVTGITIWENIGLEFVGNTFNGMDGSGIGGIDFSAKIIGENKFENGKFGIEIHSTAPHTSSVLIEGNYFDGNETHVYSASASSDFGLRVIDNEFFKSDQYGVRIEGPSTYNIEKNSFSGNALSGVVATNTRDEFSFVRGNFLGQGKEGITFYGNNSRTQFLSNCFTMDMTDVAVEQLGTSLGRVRTFQGNSGLPASNCFTNGIEHIGASAGQTLSFNYFIPLNGEPQDDDCSGQIIPLINGNNYTNTNASVNTIQSCGKFEGLVGNYTFSDLNTTRNDKLSIRQALLVTPNAQNLLMQLDQKEELEDRIEAFLEHDALQTGDFDLAESIYTNQTDRDARLSLYGLKLKRRQFAQARIILNDLTINSTEEQLFSQIQDINLNRWEEPGFVLGKAEKDFPYNTAISDSEIRAYAGALYFLLTGERAIPDLPNQSVGYRTEEPLAEKGPLASGYAVFPVPTTSTISIAMPEDDPRSGVVELHDVTGKRLFAMPFATNQGKSLTFSVSELPKGFLILSVRRGGILTFTSKVIVQD